MQNLLFLDGVLEAVLRLQGLHLLLGVLDEGGLIDAVAVVGLLVVLQDLVQLVSGLVVAGGIGAFGEADDILVAFGKTCFHG